MDAATDAPSLPAGRIVALPAGDVYLRDIAGPEGAPTVVLLHGWTGSADINFFTCYAPLAERFRVLAFDVRGHGRGVRCTRPFRLADCADDVIALADAVGAESIIPVGYSLGGAVAQLVWRRHPDRVRGVVLCSTAARFDGEPINRTNFVGLSGLAALARVTPVAARRRLTGRYLQRKREWEPWAIEVANSHDWRMVFEAGFALGRFRSNDWIPELTGPASVVITAQDAVVPAARQRELAELVRDVAVFEIDAAHDAAVSRSDLFLPALVAAIDSVNERAT